MRAAFFKRGEVEVYVVNYYYYYKSEGNNENAANVAAADHNDGLSHPQQEMSVEGIAEKRSFL